MMEAKVRTNASSLSPQMFGVKALLFCATFAPCCFFLLINSFLLQIVCSKSTFSQCPRYILLFNLALGDMLLMAQGQALYLLGFFQIRISYPLCGCFVMITALSCLISPYTLIFMSLERCVSVCFPFKHATLVTLRNTFACICVIWTLGCADVLTRVILLLDFPFADLPSLLMPTFCDTRALFLGPRSAVHDLASCYSLFVFSSLVISASFVAVMAVARSASSDKESTDKVKRTLGLHLFQSALNLASTLNAVLFTVAADTQGEQWMGKVFVVVYLLLILCPRGVSALTYGLRDPNLRPLILSRLRLRARVRLGPVHVHVTLQKTDKVY